MPSKAKDFFYWENHQRQDAELHAPILSGGDHNAALAVSRAVMRRLGFSEAKINALSKSAPHRRSQPFAGAMYFDRYNENHDPDNGEFTSGSGGGSGGSVAPTESIAASKAPAASASAKAPAAKSAEPVGYEFVSPSVADHMSFDEAVTAVGSDQQRALRDASLYINGALGMAAKEHDIVGAWADGAENSVMDVVDNADWDKLVLSGSMKGYLADQKSVLIFQQSPAGQHALAKFDAKGDLATIHKHLLEDGVAFHSLVPTKDGATVYVAMVDQPTVKDSIAAVMKGAARYDAEVEIHYGHGEFLGVQSDGSDREQRDNSRAAYESNIGKSKVAGSRELWQRVRDRWSEAHQVSVSGFSPGIKAESDPARISATKADWIGTSPLKSIDDLLAVAKSSQDRLGAVGRQVSERLGIQFKDPGPKTKDQDGVDRVKVKIKERDGVAAAVTDIARATFIVNEPEQSKEVADELAKHFEVTLENWRQTKLGYLDRTALVRFPSGLVGEIQFMDPEMAKAKSDKAGGGGGHGMYVQWRTLVDAGKANSKRALALVDRMKALYGGVVANYSSAWKAAIGKSGT